MTTELPAPQERLFGLIMGFMTAQIAHAFARMNLAEVIGEGASAEQVATQLKAAPDSARRFLRACASLGLLSCDGKTYRVTEMGEYLSDKKPGSMKSFAAAVPAESHWQPWGRLRDAVATGRSPTEQCFGGDIWAYFNGHREELEMFAGAMGNLSQLAADQAADAYDVQAYKTIADIGGSHGVLLSQLLKRAPQARGVLFDLPKVIEGAGATLKGAGVEERVQTVAGDFFEKIPVMADLYIMKHIIHDWDDERSVKILRNIAAAAPGHAKLALFEIVMPGEVVNDPVPYLMDLNMLVMVNGRERTEAEYRELLKAGGWTLQRVVPTQGMFCIIESTRA